MEHLLLNKELSLLAKEKGFDEPCLGVWHFEELEFSWKGKPFKNTSNEAVKAPLYQQIVDWFEEKHRILLLPTRIAGGPWYVELVKDCDKTHKGYGNNLYYDKTISINNGFKGFDSRKKALNEAIFQAFKLIQ
jgi:hypothetical protein